MSFAAVGPGTDLATHARELQRVHDAVLAGSRPAHRPRPLVARSWARVVGMGLEPDGPNARDSLPWADLAALRARSPLSWVVDELRSVLTSVADASLFLMVVCDADGTILWREGSPKVRSTADRLGFCEGARWTERQVGTNAIGTALAEAAPVQLFSAEHFEQQQHPWYCTAAPIHDPRTGELLGVVDVSGPALTLHPALVSLVASAVRLAEAELGRRHRDELERLRRRAEPLVGGLAGPLLVVDDLGWVAHHAGVAHRDRVEVPRAGRALAVPGVGLCVPEPLAGGWVVRPQGEQDVVRARLDLTGPAPVLVVSAGAAPWRVELTRRQGQVLAVLARAGAAGVTAADLSRALYGDPDHAVSARAEVSRLRRVVGALVTTNPYRVADGVALEVAAPGAGY
ncbi:GAF domain-containing protein [Nocardioides marinquilinus]|uniref:GAF domain-containing protein n=1 Tax=Nocardioides marinquilinus TaxID=1210400 RepID=A0ABP9PT93_9ACTN